MSDLMDYRWVLGGVAVLGIVAWCWFLFEDARRMLMELERQNDR